jgi:glycosyltransferase involved in cell wall biosynthesis
MKNKPRLSIVIPAINEEAFIALTLASIKNQTFTDYEVIVVDSYSTDRTVEISKKFGAKVITVPKKGPGAARNRGVEAANGEIILFLDADTTFTKDNCLDTLNQNFTDEVTTAMFMFKPDQIPLHQYFFYNLTKAITIFNSWINRPFTMGFAMAVRKSSFLEVNGFDERIGVCEDLDLSLRIKERCGGKFILVLPGVINSARRFSKMGFFGTLQFYVGPVIMTSIFRRPSKRRFESIDSLK